MARVRLNPAIPFYASPAEFGGWVRDWVRHCRLTYLFAKQFLLPEQPRFEVCQSVPWDDPRAVTEVVRSYRQLYLSVVPLDAAVPNINHLPVANRDHLHINLPEFTPRGLYAASLGSVSPVPESVKVYRAVARDLLSRTEEGVWFRLDGCKKQTLDRDTRFGPGAELLLEHGVPLCGGGRVVVARFGIGRRKRPS